MTPEPFTPEEVVALKALVAKTVAFNRCVAEFLEKNPTVDIKTAREVLAMTFRYEE